jgi:hypothetical protein
MKTTSFRPKKYASLGICLFLLVILLSIVFLMFFSGLSAEGLIGFKPPPILPIDKCDDTCKNLIGTMYMNYAGSRFQYNKLKDEYNKLNHEFNILKNAYEQDRRNHAKKLAMVKKNDELNKKKNEFLNKENEFRSRERDIINRYNQASKPLSEGGSPERKKTHDEVRLAINGFP